MWPFDRTNSACRSFEASLEDHLQSLAADPAARPSPALAAHLAACAACREAFDLACQAGPLVREAVTPVPESLASDPYFAVRVAARIREHAANSSEFLPLLQTVSLRLMVGALSFAFFLGVLSAAGVTRTSHPPAMAFRSAGFRAVSPEVNPAPANPDDVVIALLSSERGRQPR
jgi:predicted anti-sigma-YlaC factor YlaD